MISLQPKARVVDGDGKLTPVTDTVPPTETVGLPFSDNDALTDGNDAEAEIVAPIEILGLS